MISQPATVQAMLNMCLQEYIVMHTQGSRCVTLTGHEILGHAIYSGANCCAVALHKETCDRYYILEKGKPDTLTQMIVSAAFTEYLVYMLLVF